LYVLGRNVNRCVVAQQTKQNNHSVGSGWALEYALKSMEGPRTDSHLRAARELRRAGQLVQTGIRICLHLQFADHRLRNDRVLKPEPHDSRDANRRVNRSQRLASLIQLQEQVPRKQRRNTFPGLLAPSHALSEPRVVDFKALSLKIGLSESFARWFCVNQVPVQHIAAASQLRVTFQDCVHSLNAPSL
jgi:hypothetical protein